MNSGNAGPPRNFGDRRDDREYGRYPSQPLRDQRDARYHRVDDRSSQQTSRLGMHPRNDRATTQPTRPMPRDRRANYHHAIDTPQQNRRQNREGAPCFRNPEPSVRSNWPRSSNADLSCTSIITPLPENPNRAYVMSQLSFLRRRGAECIDPLGTFHTSALATFRCPDALTNALESSAGWFSKVGATMHRISMPARVGLRNSGNAIRMNELEAFLSDFCESRDISVSRTHPDFAIVQVGALEPFRRLMRIDGTWQQFFEAVCHVSYEPLRAEDQKLRPSTSSRTSKFVDGRRPLSNTDQTCNEGTSCGHEVIARTNEDHHDKTHRQPEEIPIIQSQSRDILPQDREPDTTESRNASKRRIALDKASAHDLSKTETFSRQDIVKSMDAVREQDKISRMVVNQSKVGSERFHIRRCEAIPTIDSPQLNDPSFQRPLEPKGNDGTKNLLPTDRPADSTVIYSGWEDALLQDAALKPKEFSQFKEHTDEGPISSPGGQTVWKRREIHVGVNKSSRKHAQNRITSPSVAIGRVSKPKKDTGFQMRKGVTAVMKSLVSSINSRGKTSPPHALSKQAKSAILRHEYSSKSKPKTSKRHMMPRSNSHLGMDTVSPDTGKSTIEKRAHHPTEAINSEKMNNFSAKQGGSREDDTKNLSAIGMEGIERSVSNSSREVINKVSKNPGEPSRSQRLDNHACKETATDNQAVSLKFQKNQDGNRQTPQKRPREGECCVSANLEERVHKLRPILLRGLTTEKCECFASLEDDSSQYCEPQELVHSYDNSFELDPSVVWFGTVSIGTSSLLQGYLVETAKLNKPAAIQALSNLPANLTVGKYESFRQKTIQEILKRPCYKMIVNARNVNYETLTAVNDASTVKARNMKNMLDIMDSLRKRQEVGICNSDLAGMDPNSVVLIAPVTPLTVKLSPISWRYEEYAERDSLVVIIGSKAVENRKLRSVALND